MMPQMLNCLLDIFRQLTFGSAPTATSHRRFHVDAEIEGKHLVVEKPSCHKAAKLAAAFG
jgi:hypothetical protein